jgi:hypothetical protein
MEIFTVGEHICREKFVHASNYFFSPSLQICLKLLLPSYGGSLKALESSHNAGHK